MQTTEVNKSVLKNSKTCYEIKLENEKSTIQRSSQTCHKIKQPSIAIAESKN